MNLIFFGMPKYNNIQGVWITVTYARNTSNLNCIGRAARYASNPRSVGRHAPRRNSRRVLVSILVGLLWRIYTHEGGDDYITGVFKMIYDDGQ